MSATCALLIFSNQLQRYLNDPTVIALEIDYRKWVFEPNAVTMCSEFVANSNASTWLIKYYWNLSEADDDFSYYECYLETIATATYRNLSVFGHFMDRGKDLNRVDMLHVVRAVLNMNFKYQYTYIFCLKIKVTVFPFQFESTTINDLRLNCKLEFHCK